eukprot:5849191-Pleurochrysis_carterae.AAC.1
MADADDDEAMQLALAMSMSQEGNAAPAPAPAAANSDLTAVLRDSNFLQSVLGSLPGVDTNDPRIQSVLNSAGAAKDPDTDTKKDDDKSGS